MIPLRSDDCILLTIYYIARIKLYSNGMQPTAMLTKMIAMDRGTCLHSNTVIEPKWVTDMLYYDFQINEDIHKYSYIRVQCFISSEFQMK